MEALSGQPNQIVTHAKRFVQPRRKFSSNEEN
jgi:hypothetical protein